MQSFRFPGWIDGRMSGLIVVSIFVSWTGFQDFQDGQDFLTGEKKEGRTGFYLFKFPGSEIGDAKSYCASALTPPLTHASSRSIEGSRIRKPGVPLKEVNDRHNLCGFVSVPPTAATASRTNGNRAAGRQARWAAERQRVGRLSQIPQCFEMTRMGRCGTTVARMSRVQSTNFEIALQAARWEIILCTHPPSFPAGHSRSLSC